MAATDPTAPDRWLAFEGLANARDVGGLPVRGGGTTRRGVLLRSESLRDVTDSDMRFLTQDFGLRLVLDLRTPFEVDRDGPSPVAAAGVETVRLTLIGKRRDPVPRTGEDTDPLLRDYLGYLDDIPSNVVEAVRRLADAGPSLVHCAVGKDRTGVLVALVLDAVGVRREAVVADYALTAQRIGAIFRRWSAADGFPAPTDLTPYLPRAQVMAAVLEHLDHTHARHGMGGGAGWLRAHGLDQAALVRLRERLVISGDR